MKLRIPANILRAAQHCQGANDSRGYLNGIMLRTATKGVEIVGSNGHILFRATVPDIEVSENTLLKIDGAIPVSADACELRTNDKTGEGTVHCLRDQPGGGERVKKILLCTAHTDSEHVRSGFDPSKVIPLDTAPVEQIGIDTNYLHMPLKVYGKTWVAWQFNGPDSPMSVRPTILARDWPDDTVLVIMPSRL